MAKSGKVIFLAYSDTSHHAHRECIPGNTPEVQEKINILIKYETANLFSLIGE